MTQVLNATIDRTASIPQSESRAVSGNLVLISQLALAAAVVYLYRIEGPAFFRIFLLAAGGFALNLAIPARYRLQYFSLLSLTGAVVVFGPADAAWLIGSGLVMIALCHLPFSVSIRTALLVLTGAFLALLRGGALASPWSAAVWPILGSMFMFRLVLYMMAVSSGKADSTWGALAYFFMLPNLVFPLFPVVDYQTFRRTHYDKSAFGIYEQGLLWISRGLVHLLLYRVVYHSVLNDPADVVRLSDLVQHMLGTFLLYLRVSGQFHLIVGILHLFGFRLPETHKLYYLAHSFTELWRRINIYWTDFMMKTVFYPTYFKVKKAGPASALVIATAAVFVTTWVLHSYQWFWLRGGFPLTLQDALFWGFLGWLVVAGALKELKSVKKPRTVTGGWNWRMGVRAAATFTAFCFLWSLWSTQSVTDWLWMLGFAANVDVKGLFLLFAGVGTIFVLGSLDWDAAPGTGPSLWAVVRKPVVRTSVPLVVLVVLAVPAVRQHSPTVVAAGLGSLHTTGLNVRDAALQHRGYYEQLDVRPQLNGEVLEALGSQRATWQDLGSIGVIRDRRDLMLRDLYPSKSLMWNGNSFSTNRWGMRDKDYSKEKPAGTLRIALLGPSHVMGNGVGDGQTFEGLVEDRLNRELRLPGYTRIEILNFAVDGFALGQQVAMLEDRVLEFSPDLVIATHYHRNRLMTEGLVVKVTTRGYDVADPGLQRLLKKAGLAGMALDGVPVPFKTGRDLAGLLGIQARMPTGEVEARARWIADDVMEWSVRRFADVTRLRAVTPAVLGLNAVIDDVPRGVPYQTAIETAGLPLFNLLDIFAESDRAALRVAPWDDHPNATGHRYIAERFYPELAAFLTRSWGSSVMASSHDQTDRGQRR